MTVWIIEPHDPLIVRDGKPFGPNPGARASSLAFPFPSTTTGGLRTRAGLNTDGVFDIKKTSDVKKINVHGPLLVQLKSDTRDNQIEDWLVPAPLDALLLDDEEKKRTICKQLVPLQTEKTYTNLEGLSLVGLEQHDPKKPSKKAPQYWYWKHFERWLLSPSEAHGKPIPSELGLNGPQREYRTHVSVDAEGLVAKEGALFQTSGIEFTVTSGKQETRLNEAKRLALAMVVENGTGLSIQEGLGSFGGERRTVVWRKSESNILTNLLTCPELIRKEIINQKACRVILLTPAYFTEGYYPHYLLEKNSDVKPELKAIAVQRPKAISGWDLENGRPKPSRRLAPVGTVLFLKLDDNASPEAIESWIESIWMKCISDKAEDGSDSYCNDGFGLAVLGTWSGQPVEMEQEEQQ